MSTIMVDKVYYDAKSVIYEAQQFTRSWMDQFFAQVEIMEDRTLDSSDLSLQTTLSGKLMLILFSTPSDKTRVFFEAAMKKLGGNVISVVGFNSFSSAVNSIPPINDMISVYCNGVMPDIVVFRHHEEGAVEEALKFCSVPFINAGSGKTGPHPVQALADACVIKKAFGSTDNKSIAYIGGVNERNARSNCFLAARFFENVKFWFASPEFSGIGPNLKAHLTRHGICFNETDNLSDVVELCDVFYHNGFQNIPLHEIGNKLTIDSKLVLQMKESAIIMHPMPRKANEIALSVDTDKRAKYLTEQLRYALISRMVLLQSMLT